jgi:hypothetical protein
MANPEIIFTCNSHCWSSKYIWSNPAVTTQHDTQHTVLLQEYNSLKFNSNRFWEVNAWSNPPWQQNNKHVKSISHTQFNNNWKINSHTSNQDETQSQWDILPHCRAKITCNSTQARTRSRI